MRRSAGPAIHVVGSMMIDRVVRVRALPRAGETVAAQSSATFAGGKGANQAAAAAKCGAGVRMLGRGGADSRFIVEALREAGVRTRAIALDDPCAGAATVMVAESGENAIVIAPEANTRITITDIERFLEGAQQGDLVLFQNECSCLHEGIAAAAARGLRVWLNAAPADARLAGLRYEKLAGLAVNETEAEALTGERDPARALEALAARMPGGAVIVTLGAGGAIAAAGSARYAHRGFVVDAVDTVGCGDAFVGAFLSGIAAGLDMPRALARGNAAGALAAMREGAIPSLPSRAEVEVAELLPEGSRLKPRPRGSEAGGIPARCERCDYHLAGSTVGDNCPECGFAVEPARFRGAWSTASGRRRFAAGAWVMACGAASFALVTVLVLLSTGGMATTVGVAYVVGLVVSQVTLPLGMFAMARHPADARRRTIGASAAAVRMLAMLAVLAIGFLPVVGRSGSTRLMDVCIAVIAFSDVVFAWSIEHVARGTRVAPIPRARWIVMCALGALAAIVWSRSVLVSPRPPYGALISSAVFLGWTSAELLALARRMRALERA